MPIRRCSSKSAAMRRPRGVRSLPITSRYDPFSKRHAVGHRTLRHLCLDRGLRGHLLLAILARCRGGGTRRRCARRHTRGAPDRCPAASRPGVGAALRHAVYLDVPARELDALARQPLVSLDLRRQCRGCPGTRTLRALLPGLWHRRCVRPGAGRSALGVSHHWRERRHLRRARRIPAAVSPRPGAHPRPAAVLSHHLRVPAMLLLLLWFAVQLVSDLALAGDASVAFRAHIGGFLAGMLLAPLLKRREGRLCAA